MRLNRWFCFVAVVGLGLAVLLPARAGQPDQAQVKLSQVVALMKAKLPLRAVVGLLGTPLAAFQPSENIEVGGFAGWPDEVVFRYEPLVHVGHQRKMDLWVVFGGPNTTIRRIVVGFAPSEKDLPTKHDVIGSVGPPKRIVHVKRRELPDGDEELEDCNDPAGKTEVWLYASGLEVFFYPATEESPGMVDFLVYQPDVVKKEYPDCKK